MTAVPDLPLLILAATISLYWIGVGAMVVRVRRRVRRDALVPEQGREKLMGLVWVPLVAAWVALPWIGMSHHEGPLALPADAHARTTFFTLRLVAALAAVACLLATARCWKRMGDDWRMAVDTRSSALITDGPFSRIRHPIYAFSIALMVASAIVLPTAAMLAVAVLHVSLMVAKARNEEAHMASVHGEAYARYAARTGRFVPRLTTREP